jgi:hypothetical protein
VERRERLCSAIDEEQATVWRVDDVGEALITLGNVLVRTDGLKKLSDLGRD